MFTFIMSFASLVVGYYLGKSGVLDAAIKKTAAQIKEDLNRNKLP